MNVETLFSCADFAMLRAPVHPVRRLRDACPEVAEGTADERRHLVDYLRRGAADPLVREAVTVSSASLGRVLDRVLNPAADASAATPPSLAGLRRAVRALTAYRVRMATRPTPFGLMAGVSAVTFMDGPDSDGRDCGVKVRFGTEHRRAVRPDRQWLTALLTDWEQQPQVLRQLRVTLNNLCFVRGGRLVLPYLPHTVTELRAHRTVHEVSMRHTPALRLVVEEARLPVPFAELERRLSAAFPQAPQSSAEGMLAQLVQKEVLLTEIRPPPEATDPLGYVLDVLTGLPEIGELPGVAELRLVRDGLSRYAADPLGAGLTSWRDVTDRMARLRPAERLVQVDLALDADVVLPREVAAEAERAARLLWRLAPEENGPASLRQYHEAFLERYSTDRLVPVKEVLDPDIGLRAPAGYNMPPGSRFARPEPVTETERDRVVSELVQEALLAGRAEVVLRDDSSDPLVSRLAGDDGTPPASLELWTRLLAESPAALQNGDFQLVVVGGSQRAGATFGRFAYLLPETTQLALTGLARSVRYPNPGARPVQLTYQTSHSRGGNVSQVPQWLDQRVPVAMFADRDDPRNLDLDDLVVGADPRRMFVVDRRSGREVVPTAFHMLDPQRLAPNVACFLGEVALSGVRRWRPWNWGPAETFPYLPRVRCGRTVLAQARWRATSELRDAKAPFVRWADTVRAWRERWRVPDRVCLSYSDQRLELDLTDRQHLRLLRRELQRRPSAELYEVQAGAENEAGWLVGSGAHRTEIIFPMVTRYTSAEQVAGVRVGGQGLPLASPHHAAREHLPGGEWLYVSVYCAAERQDELLAVELPSLLHSLPEGIDRWFFVRYGDQDQPQLRMRFHGTPEVLAAEGLPRLHEWAARLRTAGLTRRLILDTYDPETERYGGPQAIEAAERAFHADSLAVIEQLQLLATGQLSLDPLVLAAANYVDLVRTFWPDDPLVDRDPAHTPEPAWVDWLLGAYTKNSGGEAHRAFQERRREAVPLIDPYGEWPGLRARPGGEAVVASWSRRAQAIAEYGITLRRISSPWVAPPRVLHSLFHMHHNRLIGIDRQNEQITYAVARGAVQAHRDRRRHLG
jgi:thiopeptide-type bacteriocin biosynthesis protein